MRRDFYENEIGHVLETTEIIKCKQTGVPWLPQLFLAFGEGEEGGGGN